MAAQCFKNLAPKYEQLKEMQNILHFTEGFLFSPPALLCEHNEFIPEAAFEHPIIPIPSLHFFSWHFMTNFLRKTLKADSAAFSQLVLHVSKPMELHADHLCRNITFAHASKLTAPARRHADIHAKTCSFQCSGEQTLPDGVQCTSCTSQDRGGNGHPMVACFQTALGIAGAWENGSAQHEALLHGYVFALEVSWNS